MKLKADFQKRFTNFHIFSELSRVIILIFCLLMMLLLTRKLHQMTQLENFPLEHKRQLLPYVNGSKFCFFQENVKNGLFV